MGSVHHRVLRTNGINMHIAEQGHGPLVLLCHGFPELWYSWRHQLPALAAAGYHVVAPDQRGYGQTDRPDEIEAYSLLHATGDMVGLVQAVGAEQAVIIGHDWGAPVAWFCSLLRPDLFPALGLLSVPYFPRADSPPSEAMRLVAGEQQFYQQYFQEPGKAEAEFEADVRTSLLKFLYSNSGDARPEQRWQFVFGKEAHCLDSATVPERLPPWLTPQDLAIFTQAFERTGFRGGLNWYRNADRTWELTSFLRGAKLRQPALFIAGEHDTLMTLNRSAIDTLEDVMPKLRKKVVLPGAGHWIQQERPTEVNGLLLEFLAGLGT